MVTDTEPGREILSATDCWDRLREAPVGRLAVIVHSHPEIFPVNHLVDDGSLLFRSAEGTKLAGAVGHVVAFEIDGYDLEAGTAWSVMVKGQAVEVTRMDDIKDILGYPLFPWHIGHKPHFIRIEPISTTGRLYQLARNELTANAGG
ncbi:pyridoxamine 5'-phosphate oxidase family protein [Lapillicoccus sp.]|uniref:pyridoxamine 5'-phosphate oxidase family protein n=1 Tax=Lapillicoccus sp. TaxID=1909287 RepID=UPI003267CD0E